jgi:hypothetical protein
MKGFHNSPGKNIGLPKHGLDIFGSESVFQILGPVPTVPLKPLGVRDKVFQPLNRNRIRAELH